MLRENAARVILDFTKRDGAHARTFETERKPANAAEQVEDTKLCHHSPGSLAMSARSSAMMPPWP